MSLRSVDKNLQKIQSYIIDTLPISLSVALLQILKPHPLPKVLTIQASYFDEHTGFGTKTFMMGS